MRVVLPPTIRSISGRIGNFVYKTRYDAEGNPRVFAQHIPQPRSTPVSEHENNLRTRFGAIARAVHLRQKAGDKRPKQEIWQEVAAAYDAANNESLTIKKREDEQAET